MRNRSTFMTFGMLLMPMLMLQGCLNVATSGASAIYNRHSLQRNLKDQVTTLRVNQALNIKTSLFGDANITVSTMDDEVLLAGQVPNDWQKEKAETIVRNIPDVKMVYNFITVASPSSTLTYVSDAWITTKVKARLMASDDLDATKVRVLTENGKVYLIGALSQDEAEAATEIASDTDGVLGVVKLISYVTTSKRVVEM